MIAAYFFTAKNGDLLGFSISGHAEWGISGDDIVCSAVSSATFMTANTITDIIGVSADVTIDKTGSMILKISPNDSYRCREILLGFKLHMVILEDQYPENIKVNYTEV